LPEQAGDITQRAEAPSPPPFAGSSFVLLSSADLEFLLLLWFTSKFSTGIAKFSSISEQIQRYITAKFYHIQIQKLLQETR
jgi:hypothetical protein